jgi:hypothetical protein
MDTKEVPTKERNDNTKNETKDTEINQDLIAFIIDYYKGYFETVNLEVNANEMPFRSWAIKSMSNVLAVAEELKEEILTMRLNGTFGMRDTNDDITDEFAQLIYGYSLSLLKQMHFIGKLFDTFSEYGKDPLPNGDCLCGSALDDYLNRQFELFVKRFVL